MAGSWSFRAIARAVAPELDMDVRMDPHWASVRTPPLVRLRPDAVTRPARDGGVAAVAGSDGRGEGSEPGFGAISAIGWSESFAVDGPRGRSVRHPTFSVQRLL
jgi:hypothetical protein